MVNYTQIKNSESDGMVSGELIEYLGLYYNKKGSGVYKRSFNDEVTLTVKVGNRSKVGSCSVYVFGSGVHVKVRNIDELKQLEDSILLEVDSAVYYSRYHRLIVDELTVQGYDSVLIDDGMRKLSKLSSSKVLGAIKRNIEEE